MNHRKMTGALLALVALGSASAANAAAPCLTEDEVSSVVVYAMPGVIEATRTSCAAQLSARGFMANGADAMAQRYAREGNAAWPKAKGALLKLGKLKPDQAQMFAQLPEEAVRPLVDALVVQMVSQQIKPGSCRNIERLVQVLDMLEPKETAALSGIIASLALTGDKEVQVCPARPS